VKQYYLLFFLLIICFEIKAQQLESDRYVFSDAGINHSSVSRDIRDITMDSVGFLWLATDRGLLRFDGSHYFQYDASNQEVFFPGSAVDRIKYSDGAVYLVSRKDGLIKIDIRTFEIDYLVQEGVFDIATDDENKILFVMKATNVLQEYREGALLREVHIGAGFSIMEYFKNALYIATQDHGVYFLDTDRFEVTNLSDIYDYPIPTGWKEYIIKSSEHTVDLIIDQQVLRVTDNTISNPENLFFCSASTEYYVPEIGNSTKLIPDDGFYFCDNRLYRGQMTSNDESEHIANIHPNFEIRRFVTFNDRDLLLVTNKGLKLLQKKADNLGFFDDVKLDVAHMPRVRRAIVELKEGKLLFLGNPGIFLVNALGGITLTKNEERYMFFDAINVDNNTVIATTEGDGLIKLTIADGVLHREKLDESSSEFIYSITELNSKELISGGKGYVSVIDKDFTVKRDVIISTISTHILASDIIMDIHIDHKNRGIWFATDSGLSLFQNDLSHEIKFYSNADSSAIKLNNRSISAILQSEVGDTLWLAGENGIDVIDLKSETHLSHIQHWNKDLNTRVTGLVQDHYGNIWASTYDGLIVLEKKEGRIITMDSNMGLLNQEFNYKSSLLLSDGNIIFGGTSGYDIIDPQIIYTTTTTTNTIHLTMLEYIYPDKSVKNPVYTIETQPSIRFRSDKHAIRLYFSVLDFMNSENYRLEYKLNQSPWMKMDQSNAITLGNLAGGSHQLTIRARGILGELIKEELQIQVHADIPFYHRVLFYSIIYSLIGVLLISLFYYITKYYRNEIEIKNNISMDLHDVVGTSLTRSSLLMEEHFDPSNRYHIRILQNIKDSNFTLRSFISTMSIHKIQGDELLSEIRDTIYNLLEGSSINFKFNLNEKSINQKKYSGELFRDLKIILFELCTNVIKHANAASIDIAIEQVRDNFILQFSDDGGIKDIMSMELSKGYGLKNIKKRLERHNGTLTTSIREDGNGLMIILTIKTT
jgi:anti-sigma regulatory factor (Ser/Thr protein kinase)